MRKNGFRVLINKFYLKGSTSREIKAELDEVHDTFALMFATLYNSVNELKCDCMFIKDKYRSECPVEMNLTKMNFKTVLALFLLQSQTVLR